MAGEISLDKRIEKMVLEEERGLLGNLEEKVGHLLIKYQEYKFLSYIQFNIKMNDN